MKQPTKTKTPKLKALIDINGIEISVLSTDCNMAASSFRSKIRPDELYRYFSDEEYQNVLNALKLHAARINQFLKNHDRKAQFKKVNDLKK